MAQVNAQYGLEAVIPDELLMRNDASEYVIRRIEMLKREGAIKVFDEIYKASHPTVVETHIEEWRDMMSRHTHYRLHYRLTAVQMRNVTWATMPELSVFTFKNHEGKIEWKCPACAIINIIDATYCGEKHERAVGCGRPREKVRQEL